MMTLVRHKYNAHEVSDAERAATFAARHQILNLILQRLHDGGGTSFLLTGTRGAGKSTLVHLVRQKIEETPELSQAWLPVILPEEQIGVASLRDLLSVILEQLATTGISVAEGFHRQCEEELDEEVSEALAIQGIASVATAVAKTLLVAIENLDQLFERALSDERMQSTLRRLLMHDRHMCLLGTSVSVLNEWQEYEHPFWEYFEHIPLRSLDDGQTDEVLNRRAEFEENANFLLRYQKSRGLVRAINRLTGGNPRLIVMLYEVVSIGDVESTVAVLRQLLDQLTPLYNGLLDRLSSQHRKIVDAIMRQGGQATIGKIATATRLPQNTVRAQLTRLKDTGCVSVVGGGKGKEAGYAIEDRLFSTWYQLRYFRPQRRRIEIFIEVLRAWFSAEERQERFNEILEGAVTPDDIAQKELARHLLASLEGTEYYEKGEHLWKELSTEGLDADNTDMGAGSEGATVYNRSSSAPGASASDAVELHSAGQAGHDAGDLHERKLAELTRIIELPNVSSEQVSNALNNRGVTYSRLGDHKRAIGDFTRVIEMPGVSPEQRVKAAINRGAAYGRLEDHRRAIDDFTRVIEMPDVSPEQLAKALNNRGIAYGRMGDQQPQVRDYRLIVELPNAPVDQGTKSVNNCGVTYDWKRGYQQAMNDFTRATELADAPLRQVVRAFYNRGVAYDRVGDHQRAKDDFTHVIEMPDAPTDEVAKALNSRGFTSGRAGDHQRAKDDFTQVIEMPDAPTDQVAKALNNRGVAYGRMGEQQREMDDYTRVIELPDAPLDQVAQALLYRGITYGGTGDHQRAIDDYTRIIELPNAPFNHMAKALNNRGVAYSRMGEQQREIEDYTRVIELTDAPPDQVAQALLYRGVTYGEMGDYQREINDYTRVIEMPSAPRDQVTQALLNRGVTYGGMGNHQREIDDYTRVIELTDAPPDHVAQALLSRGVTYSCMGNHQREIDDYTRVIELADAPADHVAQALLSRGVSYSRMGNHQREIDDYTRVIELTDAPPGHLAQALLYRGVTYGVMGDYQRAIDDFTRVIELPGAPPDHVAQALLNRGVTYGRIGDHEQKIHDCTRVIELPGASVEQLARAYVQRSDCFNIQEAYGKTLHDARDLMDIADVPSEYRSIASVNAGTALANLHRWDDAVSSYRSAVQDFDISDKHRKQVAAHIVLESSHQRIVATHPVFAGQALEIGVNAFPVTSGSDAVELLQSLAKPEMKHRWSHVFRYLSDFLPSDDRSSLEVLSPVAEMLDGADPSILNRLSPEQREFVHEVLECFEVEPT